MQASLTKTIPGRRRPNFSYSEWTFVQSAIENGCANHMIEFSDLSPHYRMNDLLNEYSSLSDEEKRRFKIAKTRKGLFTWYWAILMRPDENMQDFSYQLIV